MNPVQAAFAAQPVAATVGAVGALLIVVFVWAVVETRKLQAEEDKFINANLLKLKEKARSASAPLVAFVTGANSGIGFKLCEFLADAGVRVLLGCRHEGRGKEAIARIKKAVPHADVHLIMIDVADPVSVIKAANGLKAADSPCRGHLDLLVLNAGIMPVHHYRWWVVLRALLTGGFRHFLETSRSDPSCASFLAQPEDDVGACGAPTLFATHVLGHLLLMQELAPLLNSRADGSKSGKGAGATADDRAGRVVWTGSRSAVRVFLDWKHIDAPAALGEPSGFELQKRAGEAAHGDTYGQAKYCQDLLNAAIARKTDVNSTIICPGFVDTELTPPFFKMGIPLFGAIRKFTPGFNITAPRGTAAQIAAYLAPVGTLAADKKYVLSGGGIKPAVNGAHDMPVEAQERLWRICAQWMDVWRAYAKKQLQQAK